MSIEKEINQIVLAYLKKAEGKVAIMSPQDIAKIVKEAANQGAMLGYGVGMNTAIKTHKKELESAELTIKELNERVKRLEFEAYQ
jgi:hypothetical protein